MSNLNESLTDNRETIANNTIICDENDLINIVEHIIWRISHGKYGANLSWEECNHIANSEIKSLIKTGNLES